VLIATPGRLLDHSERGRLLMSGVELLVIDEADRMLDMGFIPDIERICKMVPFTRQTLFFTATMPAEIRRITEQFLHNPVRVEVARPATTVTTITQLLVKTGREDYEKRETLRDLIRSSEGFKNAIIFCNRKRDVAQLHLSLVRHGFSTAALHGDMDQSSRTAALDKFRRGEVALLVASDVAARGLDIPDVSHVFNFDIPYHPDDYVHRIGRTGRAGRKGTAITIIAPGDQKALAAIESLTGQPIAWSGEAVSPHDGAGEDNSPRRRRSSSGRKSETRGRDGAPKREGGRTRSGSRAKSDEQPTDGAKVAARDDASARGTERKNRERKPTPATPVTHLNEVRAPKRERKPEPAEDPSDAHLQLPAFLLRPVRIKA
jgi:superfamily II DNA/RNA helicase